ncbi:MAG: hypothetical protein ACFB0B_21310 [Thermonemataceae bacterium]
MSEYEYSVGEITLCTEKKKSEKEVGNFIRLKILYILLILSKDYKQNDYEGIFDYLEEVEENMSYLSENIVDYLVKVFDKFKVVRKDIIEIKSLVNTLLSGDWEQSIFNEGVDWIALQEKSKQILLRLEVPLDSDLEEYTDKITMFYHE